MWFRRKKKRAPDQVMISAVRDYQLEQEVKAAKVAGAEAAANLAAVLNSVAARKRLEASTLAILQKKGGPLFSINPDEQERLRLREEIRRQQEMDS